MPLAGSPIGQYAPEGAADAIDQQMETQRQQNELTQQWQQHYQDFQGAVQQQASDQADQFGDFQDAVHQQMNAQAEANQQAASSEEPGPLSFEAFRQRVLSGAGTASGTAAGATAPGAGSTGGQAPAPGGQGSSPAQAGSSTPLQSSGGGDVGSAVDAATDDPRVRMAMKLGASLEGGLSGPFGVGDNGGSFGPFQINHNAGMHQDIDRASSEDPAAATRYMLGEYQAAVEKVPPEMWTNDPKQASRLAAFYAERPAVIYDQGRVDNAWNALQSQPQPASGAGTFAEQDMSPALAALGEGSGYAEPDTGEHAAAATAGVQPVAQYNQQAPAGDFQQVTRNASGNYDVAPTAAPSPDQQAVYAAQDAATHGFTSPDVGTPLLAGSAPGAQTAVPVQPDVPQAATTGGGLDVDTSQPLVVQTPEGTQVVGQGTQPQPTDIKSILADALHQVADKIAGAVGAVGQNPAVQAVGKALDTGNMTPRPSHPLTEQDVQQALNEGSITQDQADALMRNVVHLAPAAETLGQAAMALQPLSDMALAGKGAGIADAAGTAASDTVSRVGAEGRAGQELAATPPPGYAPAASVGDVASQIVDRAAERSSAAEAAGSGPGTMKAAAPGAIEDLNNLIGSFGKAINRAATPAEATGQVAQADNAATALAKGLSDEFGKFKLTPAENQSVADILEGQRPAMPLRDEVEQAALALKASNDATWQMASKAGVLDGMTENYFTHLVRVPAAELQQMGGSITPSALSDWSRFAAGRARDEAGNVLNPTLQDLKAYLAEAHPTWQVVGDVPTVVAAHVRSLVTAANHAQLADYLKAAVGEDGLPLLSAVKRAGDVQLNVPQSLSKWLYEGQAPETGNITVASRGGVLGAADEPTQAVLTQRPLMYARPEAAKFIDRYVAPDLLAGPIERGQIPQAALKLGNVYDRINRGIVTTKLMNPLVHTWNMLSETAKQYMRPTQAAGFLGDLAKANAVLRDPTAMTRLLQEAPLNLSSVRQFAAKLAQVTGRIPQASDIPVMSGGRNIASKLVEADHNLLFNTIGQRLQLASYFGATRDGMEPVVAAKYANAKFGQFSRQDFNALTRWVNQHVAFAGNWTAGGLVQYGTLLRSAGYGGYATGLTPMQTKALSGALRGDLLRGIAAGAAGAALVNHATSGHWPWENKPGRMLDIELPNGAAIPNPFFKREQDVVKLVTGVGGSLKGGDVAGAVQAPVGIAANKATPLMSAAGGAKDASTAIRKGGDFGTSLERSLQYLGSVALPGVQPPQYKQSPDIGPIGTALGLRELNAPGKQSGSGRPAAPRAPSRPH